MDLEGSVMGMTITVSFTDNPPAWADVARYLAEHGFTVGMRMIDGQLAFPDEEPPEAWKELRVATPGGMVTMHRKPDRIDLVIWGNADGSLRQGWHALAHGWSHVGVGTIEGVTELDLPQGLRGT